MKTFDFLYSIRTTVKWDNNRQDNSQYPLVGLPVHALTHKLLELISRDLPEDIRKHKLPLPLHVTWYKNNVVINTFKNELGNALTDLLAAPLDLILTVSDENRKVTLTLQKLQITNPHELFSKVEKTHTIGIKTNTPILKPLKSHADFIRYVIKSIYRKLEIWKAQLNLPSTDPASLAYEPIFLKMFYKLFNPNNKQSYPGYHGRIHIKGDAILLKLLALSEFIPPGVKTSYGYGSCRVLIPK